MRTGAEAIPILRVERAGASWRGILSRDVQRLLGPGTPKDAEEPGRTYVWAGYSADGDGYARRVFLFDSPAGAHRYAREMGLRIFLIRLPVARLTSWAPYCKVRPRDLRRST